MSRVAIDTSVAIPLLVRSHANHVAVSRGISASEPWLTAHSLAETYSVLTRLPGDARVSPADASRLIADRFPEVVTLPGDVARDVHRILADRDIAGGAVYDGLVALAALAEGLELVTRDVRAAGTYSALGAKVALLRG